MATVDLHLHTTASDGRLPPRELVRFVARRGLKVVSITDHDSVDGLDEAFQAAGEFPGLELIPGVELSCDVPGLEVHLLGYFIDYKDTEFQKALERFRNGRVVRARRMLERLAAMGIQLDWKRVTRLAGNGAVGRPHIAQAMVEEGHVGDFREAFDRYIGRNGPAYVEREKLTPVEAVRLIGRTSGLAVLAHPGEMPDLERRVEELMAVGLVGIEVYYGDYSGETIRMLKGVAERYRLLPCGGSDYHALGIPDEVLPGDMGPPAETVESLKRLWKGRGQMEDTTVHGEVRR